MQRETVSYAFWMKNRAFFSKFNVNMNDIWSACAVSAEQAKCWTSLNMQMRSSTFPCHRRRRFCCCHRRRRSRLLYGFSIFITHAYTRFLVRFYLIFFTCISNTYFTYVISWIITDQAQKLRLKWTSTEERQPTNNKWIYGFFE